MKTNWFKRTLCSILALVLVLGYVPVQTIAAESDGLCEHHTQHTTECGYSPAVEAHDCGHEHTDDCYNSVTACVHVHEDCGYVPAVDGHGCDCQPNDSGEIVHTEGCGYVEAAAEVPCSHVCSEETGCVAKVLNCQHQHDATCGNAEEAAETPCGFVCEECAKKEAAKNGLLEIPVESVTITQEEELSEVLVGETLELKAVILPENATDKTVTWSSSDESIATVDENGVVTGVAEGEVTISIESCDKQDNYVVFSISEAQKTSNQGNLFSFGRASSIMNYSTYTSFTPGVSTTSEVIALLERLSATQNGKYWNKGCNYSELKQQALADDFGACCSDSPCISHDSKCTSNTFDGRIQCNGFANYIAYIISGDIRSTSTNWENIKLWDNTTLETIALSELQPGDVIYYKNSINLDHWVVVWYTDLDAGKLYVAEANNGGNCLINYGQARDSLTTILNRVRLVSRCKNIVNTTEPQVELTEKIAVEDYLKYYAKTVSSITKTAVTNSTSSDTWKLPWTNKSDENLKLGTVSGEITLIREIVNHLGNTWYEYSTGTSTRGFIYSGDVTLKVTEPYYDPIDSGTPTTNNTILTTTINNPSGVKLVQGGFKLGTSANNLSIVKTDNIGASYQTAATIPCSYDLKNEYSITLQPGTRYYYQFFVAEEGKLDSPYVSEVRFFDTASIAVSSISLSPTTKTLDIGDTVQLTATVSPTNATNKSLTWKSSNTSVATVSSTGLVTAKSAGTATITATAADGSGKSASATVTVQATTIQPYYSGISHGTPTANNAVLKATINNPSGVKLVQGGFKLGTSTNNLSIVKTDDISASYQTAATIPCSYDLKNEYSITLQPGTRYYYQFFVAEEGKMDAPYVSEVLSFDTASIAVSSISLSPTSKTLNIGDTVQLTATVSPTNATNKSVTWKSSNTSVATVSSTGLVTAMGEGTAAITVTAADGSGKSASATVTVNPILVSAISLSPTNKTLNIGDTVQLSATVSPSNATNKSLTWKSNNTSVATVSSAGLVTAKGAGTATITASAADGSGKSASVNITVLISSGFCGANGSNATYTLTDKGVLTITGRGKLKEYSQSATAPWYGNREKITSVVIEEGITSIGNYSFYFCSNLSSITIPEGVTSIGNYAFYECNSLQTATLPDSVSSVGEWSFAYCKSLASVKIPEGVTSIKTGTFQGCDILASVTLPQSLSSIGVQAFYNCCSLTSISIPQGVTSIGVGAFSNCESLTTFSIPEGVNAIESNTFYGCEKLTSVSIPKSVTSIGGYAFYSCLGLTSVTLPEGVTSIGEYAFRFCRSLTSISIPKNVTSIGESAFHECGALSSIHFLGNGFTGPNLFNKNVTAYYPRGNTTWTKAIRDSFGSYVTWIEVCTNHTEVVDPAKAPTCTENGLTEGKHCSACGIVLVKQEVVLATHQFEDGQCKICGLIVGSCGENLTYTLTSEGELTITGSGAMDDYVGSTSAPWYNRREEIVSVILSEGVTSIGTEAFLNCSNLISVSIPDGITSIGREAFSCCSKLSSVSIPSGVSSISDHCFYSCTKLTSVSIPEGVTQIEDGAFENCSDLTSISLPNSVTSIGDSAFSDCCRLTKITIPSGVTTIGSGAFRACSQLTEIMLPSGITTIGENTFSSCSRLKSIVIPNGVISIGNDAFRWCVGLNSVAIPSSVTNIGSDAFDNCLSLTSITIPENVTSIGESAFYESAIAEIRFLGDGFRGTSNLFSSPVVAYYAANKATWTQEIRDSFGTKVTWRDSSENCLVLNDSELIKETQIWVDGVSYPVKKDSAGSYVNIPDNTSPVLVTYSYNNSSDDAHTQYPVGMQAYRIHQTETGATVERLPELDNLLQYSGSSIRIVGKKGIRMITSVNQDTRNSLTGNGLAGFKLLEYGTLLAQTSKLGNNPLVLGGGEYVKSNYAYKKDVADPVFKYADGLIQYTNVLIGFTDEQCKEDIAMRPYMKLLDENGEEFVIYGGIVYRSIGYIAYQNRNAFQPGSAAYEYVWSIIRNVYGNQYDSEYKK